MKFEEENGSPSAFDATKKKKRNINTTYNLRIEAISFSLFYEIDKIIFDQFIVYKLEHPI